MTTGVKCAAESGDGRSESDRQAARRRTRRDATRRFPIEGSRPAREVAPPQRWSQSPAPRRCTARRRRLATRNHCQLEMWNPTDRRARRLARPEISPESRPRPTDALSLNGILAPNFRVTDCCYLRGGPSTKAPLYGSAVPANRPVEVFEGCILAVVGTSFEKRCHKNPSPGYRKWHVCR
jgi:hypothetical protein